MTSPAPQTVTPTQGLSRAEAMSLRPTRIKRVGQALELSLPNGQVLQMEGFFRPEVKPLAAQAMVKAAQVPERQTARGRQLRKAQDLLEKALQLEDGATLQDSAAMNDAGTLRNYWQVWQQWQSEALGLPDPATAAPPSDLPQATPEPVLGGNDPAMAQLPVDKKPVSSLQSSAIGLGQVGLPAVAAAGLAGGKGGGGGASAFKITTPAALSVAENSLSVTKLESNKANVSWSLDGSSEDNDLFSLSSSGELNFKARKDFEVDKRNYTVKVKASVTEIVGGSISSSNESQTLNISLTDVANEDQPNLNLVASVGESVSQAEALAGALKLGAFASGRPATVTFTRDNATVKQSITGTASEIVLKLSESELQTLSSGTVKVSVVTQDDNQPEGKRESAPVTLEFKLDTVAPTISSRSFTLAENVATVGTLSQEDAQSETVTWSLADGGADNARFSIQSSSGVLSWANGSGGDFEAKSPATYALKVKATDTAGNSTVQDISVTLTDIALESVPSLALSPNVSGTVSADEAKLSLFAVKGLANGLNLRLKLVGPANTIEKTIAVNDATMAIALADNDIQALGTGQVSVTAVCSDASGNTSLTSNTLGFTLDGVVPQIQSPATFALDENQATVTNLLANESVTWSLDSSDEANSAQNSLFNLSSTGILSFKNSAGGDFEFRNSYEVHIKATDSAGNTTLKSLTVSLNDVLVEKIPALALGNAVSGSVSLDEATSPQGFITVSNVPNGQRVELSFTRSGGGTSLTKTTNASLGQDLYVGLTDKELQDLGDGAISVTAVAISEQNRSMASTALSFNLEATAPRITSNTTLSVVENTQTIATLTANESVTWALDTHYEGVAANADAALVTLSSAGVLSWQSGSGRDYEGAVKSAAGNNNYRVRVIATDSAGNTTPQDLTVQVVDANEAPSFVAASFQGASSTPTEVNKAVALNDFQIACSDLSKVFTLVGSASNGSLNLGGYVIGGLDAINNTLKDLNFTASASGQGTITLKLYEGGSAIESNLKDTRTIDLYTKPTNQPVVVGLSVQDGQAVGGDQVAKAGDFPQFTLTLSEEVMVEGLPGISVTVGGNSLKADYTRGSGTNTLVFTAREPLPSGWSGNFSLSSFQTSDTNRIFSKATPANTLYTLIGQTDVSFKVDTIAPTIAPAVTLYHSRNLLVKTEAEAWALLDNYDLSNLSVFASLAGRFNSDSTRTKGGDLGWSPMNGYVPEYARGLLDLEHSGQKVTLAPIQSRFGWHLIYLEEVQRVAVGSSYHSDGVNSATASGDANSGYSLRIQEGAANRVVQNFYATNHESVTWAWTDDTDPAAKALFAVNASTGAITTQSSTAVNADTLYALTLKATDAAGNSTLRPLTITVTDTPALGRVSVSGTATEGQTLTASYDMSALQVAWRWQVQAADNQWSDLLGATSASLVLPKDDSLVGKRVRAVATVTDAMGDHAVRSDATAAVADAANAPTPALPAGRNATAEFIQVSGVHNGWLNANDFYVNGSSIAATPDSLSLALHLTAPVQVVGNPRVALAIGNNSVYATYDAANSTLTRLVFKYTADTSPARFDADGVSTSYYDANGATLTRANGTLLVPDFVNITSLPFDSVAPAAPTVSLLDVARTPVSAREALNEDLVSIDNTGVGNTVHVIFARDNFTVRKTLAGANQSLRVRLSAQDLAVLGEGAVNVSVIVVDPAGNPSWSYSAANAQNLPNNGGSFILDTVAPRISAQSYRVNENTSAIANLSANEPIKSWKLVPGAGDTHNSDFKLQESSGALSWAASGGQDFDAKAQTPYALRVELTDNAGNTRVEQLTVQLVNVNEALQLRWLGGTMVALPTAGASTSTGAFRSGAAAALQGWDAQDPDGASNIVYATFFASGSLKRNNSQLTDAEANLPGIQWKGSITDFNTLMGELTYTEAASGQRLGDQALQLRLSDQGYSDTSAATSLTQTLLWRQPTLTLPASPSLPYEERGAADATPSLLTPFSGFVLGHQSDNGSLRKITWSLEASNAGALGGDQFSLVQDAVTMGGTLSLTQTASGTTPSWALSSTGYTTLAQWQTALNALQYQNNSDNPGGERKLKLKLEDWQGQTLNQELTLAVVPSDDAPMLFGLTSSATQRQSVVAGSVSPLGRTVTGSNGASVFAGLSVTDPDSSTLYLQIKPFNASLTGFTSGTNAQGLSTQVDANSGVVSLSGSTAALTAALNNASFGVFAKTADDPASPQTKLEFRVSSTSASDAAGLATPTLTHYLQASASGSAADSTAPAFSPAGNLVLSSDENQRSVGSLQDLLRPNEVVVWSFLQGGEDNSRFELNPMTGVMSWRSTGDAPNFESVSKSAVDNDNLFKVSVVATDISGNSATQVVSVQLRDMDEAPMRNSTLLPTTWLRNGLSGINFANYWMDPDTPEEALSFTSADLPTGLSLSNAGALSLNAGANWPSRMAFHLTVTDAGADAASRKSTTVPLVLDVFDGTSVKPVKVDAQDNLDLAGLGRAGQALQVRVTLNTDVNVSGTVYASFIFGEQMDSNGYLTGGLSASGTYVSESNGTLLFNVALPADINSGAIRLSSLRVDGGELRSPFLATPLTDFSAYSLRPATDKALIDELTAAYTLDNSAPSQPLWQVSATALASGNGLDRSELTGKDANGNAVDAALKVLAEAGSTLNVKINGTNESREKTLTADASGITTITLTPTECAALGVGQASAQVSATDLAGNVSMLAFTDFKVL